ncbi:MAG: hypothetical protein EU540_01565 [Promethearchaeota archaeon]|nr:MAG: hypothetical protein EU540_01565 [Candidatus Lokiarchaeota archaeon]
MNEKYEVNLVESDKSVIKNSKKKESSINNHNFVSQDLRSIIKNCLLKSNTKINKILLIGNKSNYIYDQLHQVFSDVQFIIANRSVKTLNLFNNKNIEEKNYLVHFIDVFDGRALFNFTLKFNKFDLVIISNLYNHNENKKRIRYSARFIFKHLIKKKGIFCIVNSIQDSESSIFPYLKKVKPLLNNKIKMKISEGPLNLTIYVKK